MSFLFCCFQWGPRAFILIWSTFFLLACFLNTVRPHSIAWSSRQKWNLCSLVRDWDYFVLTGNFANSHKHIVLGQSLFKYLVDSKNKDSLDSRILPMEGRWWDRMDRRTLTCDSVIWVPVSREICELIWSHENLPQEMGIQEMNLICKERHNWAL